MRTVGRYLGGVVLVAMLIVGGVALRVVVTGHKDQRAPVDAIVVLGAAQYNGTPSAVFQARLDHAALLFREGVAPHVVTIGGKEPGDATTEGEAGSRYLAEQGIDPSALVSVGVGRDTLVSLRAAAQVLDAKGWHSIVLVSDPWHLARASLMAGDLGLQTEVSPVTTGPAVASGVEGRYVLRETLGILYYLVTGGSSGSGTPVI